MQKTDVERHRLSEPAVGDINQTFFSPASPYRLPPFLPFPSLYPSHSQRNPPQAFIHSFIPPIHRKTPSRTQPYSVVRHPIYELTLHRTRNPSRASVHYLKLGGHE